MSDESAAPYRVLARKYRPTTFKALIGQDALVRTLTNALASGRLPHAWLLTGVRGVGKTSTARIIARALNCIGEDGQGEPTPNPCGVCENCAAIAEDRHVDVLEMDAASRTGVGDIREIIESVRYRPTSARYKVYIIDEVHMLSSAAFNALLKTLEEPPPHVKFVFATTEVRKLPVTVLSRCQRFDLRRVDIATLSAHFSEIAETEGARIEKDALALISLAADGSVRDGLSLLDQAIAHSGDTVSEAEVRKMLGLADRSQIFDLFEQLMKGDVAAALANLDAQYVAGADPIVIVQDLLDVTHWLTRLKVSPEAGEELTTSETERVRGTEMAAALSMPALTRAWQMLLKGLGEARTAPHPLQAVEMVMVRLAYAADLPPPADLVRKLMDRDAAAPPQGSRPATDTQTTQTPAPQAQAPQAQSSQAATPQTPAPQNAPTGAPQAALAPELVVEDGPDELSRGPQTFTAVTELAADKREPRLNYWLVQDVHLVRFRPGHIELRVRDGSSDNMASQLGEYLKDWTGARWVIVISDEDGEKTLADQRAEEQEQRLQMAAENPLVKQVLEIFPGATIKEVRPRADRPDKDGDKTQ